MEKMDLRWPVFEFFNVDTNQAFENMCRRLFTEEYLKGTTIPHSDHNTPGIEVIPVLEPKREDGQPPKLISFQSKYYGKEEDAYKKFIESAEKTIKYWTGRLNLVYLFCNRTLTTESDRYKKIIKTLAEGKIEAIPITNTDLLDLLAKHPNISKDFFLPSQFANPFAPYPLLGSKNEPNTKVIDIPNPYEPTVTFLIGNGFDLSMDMKTRYKDFIEWYCQQDMYAIKAQYLEFIKSRLSNPLRWNTWSDFESDLVEFASQTDSDSERLEFKSLYIDILSQIAEYIRINQRNILKQLKLGDNTFFSRFKESIFNWYNELTEEQKAAINKQRVFFKDGVNYKYKFINFNYSILFDKLLQGALGEQDIIHIHGSIGGAGNLVMGVEDALLISTCFKAEELYYLLKNKNIDTLQDSWNQTADKYLQKSNIVCIYGMSIGRADSMWWKKLIKWLLLDGHELVIFWHTLNKEELVDLKGLRNFVIGRLVSFENLDDNEKYLLMSRTHVVINPKEFLQVTLNWGRINGTQEIRHNVLGQSHL